MPRLNYVDDIIHIKVTLPFDGDCKVVIKQIKKNVSRMSIGSPYRKAVHLSHEDNMISINNARVQMGFVDGWGEPEIPQNGVNMLLPKTWQLQMTLHS